MTYFFSQRWFPESPISSWAIVHVRVNWPVKCSSLFSTQCFAVFPLDICNQSYHYFVISIAILFAQWMWMHVRHRCDIRAALFPSLLAGPNISQRRIPGGQGTTLSPPPQFAGHTKLLQFRDGFARNAVSSLRPLYRWSEKRESARGVSFLFP